MYECGSAVKKVSNKMRFFFFLFFSFLFLFYFFFFTRVCVSDTQGFDTHSTDPENRAWALSTGSPRSSAAMGVCRNCCHRQQRQRSPVVLSMSTTSSSHLFWTAPKTYMPRARACPRDRGITRKQRTTTSFRGNFPDFFDRCGGVPGYFYLPEEAYVALPRKVRTLCKKFFHVAKTVLVSLSRHIHAQRYPVVLLSGFLFLIFFVAFVAHLNVFLVLSA